jgi:hypothetical protein
MAKKIKKYKVGIDSETYAISMVEAPAIESDFVALSKEEEVKVFLESDERHMVYGAALIPDRDIYRNNGEQEFYISFTKESIEKMSQDFMKNYRQNEVTLDHEEMANDITITESWLVEDPYRDKANALGINVPKGTWMIGMKVNQIDVWERVKSGELKGFSVESMISLEEFSKNDNNMNIETNDMGFWNKMKSILTEVFTSTSLAKQEEVDTEESEASRVEHLEEQAPMVEEPTVVETPTEPQEPIVEPKVEEGKEEVKEEPQKPQEEPKPNPLEELVKSLTDEVKALKEMNEGLQTKIKDLGKQPSANPVNTNAKPSKADTYSAWRETMRSYLS